MTINNKPKELPYFTMVVPFCGWCGHTSSTEKLPKDYNIRPPCGN